MRGRNFWAALTHPIALARQEAWGQPAAARQLVVLRREAEQRAVVLQPVLRPAARPPEAVRLAVVPRAAVLLPRARVLELPPPSAAAADCRSAY